MLRSKLFLVELAGRPSPLEPPAVSNTANGKLFFKPAPQPTKTSHFPVFELFFCVLLSGVYHWMAHLGLQAIEVYTFGIFIFF